jgi:hypothetical protein
VTRPALTYDYYTADGGTLPEVEFDAQLRGATQLVDWLTATAEVVDSNTDDYLRGICAAVDSAAENGLEDTPLSHVAIGSFSATLAKSGGQSGRSLAVTAAICRMALSVPSLLYGGIG